jgi:hypothetical protein
MYMSETGKNIRYNDPAMPGYDPSWPVTEWMGALNNYNTLGQLRLCPATHEQSPLQSQDLPGNANTEWDFGSVVTPPMSGSYGFNGWLYSYAPAPDFNSALTFPAFLFHNPESIQKPSQTPVFFDADYIEAEPIESDPPATDLYTGKAVNTPGMQRCTIWRHGGKTVSVSYRFSGPK